LTTNSGSGDPRAATAAKGEKLTGLAAERIGRFLCELAGSPLDDAFPF
jgi:creatinine amidohydrolase